MLGVLFLGVLLAGCDTASNLKMAAKKFAPPDDDAFAQQYLRILREGDLEKAKSLLDPQLVGPGVDSNLGAVASFLRQGESASFELVGCNIVSGQGRRRTDLTYECQLADSWLAASVVVDTVAGKKLIVGVHVTPVAGPLGEANAFSLSGKGAGHYVMLWLAIAIPVFILCTLIVCIRTRMRRRKWLWIIFILLGFGKVGLNWTTGGIVFNPLSFHVQLLGAGLWKEGAYAPWILSVSVPLGAILFLVLRKKLRVVPPPPMTGENPPEDTKPPGQADSEQVGRVDRPAGSPPDGSGKGGSNRPAEKQAGHAS